MDKNEFKEFCKNEFVKHGFKKIKKYFYLVGSDILCGMDLQRSDYGSIYYVNFFFCIGDYKSSTVFPTYYESDVDGRILVMSKTQRNKGHTFMTSMIEYEEYTENELRPYFEKEFEERILPPIYHGRKYILDNLNKLYQLTLRREEVMKKLQS